MIYHFLFFIRNGKSNVFSLFSLKAPLSCSKRFGLQHWQKVKKLLRAEGAFPACYCPPTEFSPEIAIARRSYLTAVAEFLGKCYRRSRSCTTARIATVVLNLIPGE